MNPSLANVPSDAFWMQHAADRLPIFNPHWMLVATVIPFVIFLLPLVFYALRWARHFASPKKVEAPGFFRSFFTLLFVPLVVVFGWASVFSAAAWWYAGGYDCSATNPVVVSRLARHDNTNLCFNVGTKTKAVEQQAAGAGTSFGHLIGGAR